MKYLMLVTTLLVVGCAGTDYSYKPGTQASLNNQRADYDGCNGSADDKAYKQYPDHVTKEGVGSAAVLTSVGMGLMAATGYGFVAVPIEDRELVKKRQSSREDFVHKCMTNKGYLAAK